MIYASAALQGSEVDDRVSDSGEGVMDVEPAFILNDCGLAALLAPGIVAAAAEPVFIASPRIRKLCVSPCSARVTLLPFEASPQPCRDNLVAQWENSFGSPADVCRCADPELPAATALLRRVTVWSASSPLQRRAARLSRSFGG